MYLYTSAAPTGKQARRVPAMCSRSPALRELRLIHYAKIQGNPWLEPRAGVIVPAAPARALFRRIGRYSGGRTGKSGTKEVYMLEPMYLVDEGTTSRATATDVFNTFTEELDSLYLLSLLLTADHDKAEQCFVCAMGGCVEGIGVFMDWARSRARRAVLKYAIQMINPIPEH